MIKKNFPFYRQLGPTDCGPTCLKIIAKFYGKEIETTDIIKNSNVLKTGISITNLSQSAEEIGFRSMPINVDFQTLKDKIPLPCIAYIGKSHYVVIYKIKKGKIYVSDPEFGLMSYTESEFISKWIFNKNENKGILIVLEPSSDFHTDDDNSSDKKIKGLKFLLKYFFEHKKLFYQLLIGLLFGSIIELIFPFFTQAIVDEGIKNKDLNFITIILIGQLIFFFAQSIIQFIRGWLLLHIGMRIHVSIISDFLYKVLKLPSYVFDVKTVGDLMQRIDDNRRIENYLSNTSLSAIFSFLNILILSIVLFVYHIKIFSIFIIGVGLYILWIFLFVKKISYWEHKRVGKNSEEREKILQLITGIKDIKLNNSHLKRTIQWRTIQGQMFNISSKRLLYNQIQNNGALFINELKNIIILFTSANLVIKGEMTLGMMLAVQYILGYLNRPVRDIISFIQNSEDANIRVKRMEEILIEEDEGENSTVFEVPENGAIKLENVSFGYGGKKARRVLKNITLEIPANKTTAIVGVSGSGKTTLLNLLLKFYEPDSGSIKVGSTNLNNINPYIWRNSCGAVMQDNIVFTDSVANNIAESEDKEIIDKNKLIESAQVASLIETVENLPSGFDTIIGSGGIRLSGGQTQRLMIARAIYKSPNYLFFDEATSFLDAKNEKIIVENLKKVLNNKTAIIIAHRLSTVKNADKIVVIDNGIIVEEGSHEELIDKQDFYFNLVKNQLELGK